MTPRAFYALVGRHRERRRHELYCAALPASAIYNVNRDPAKTPNPITPLGLIGGDNRRVPAAQAKQSAEDMLMIVRHIINPSFNGIDKTQDNG